MSVSILLVEDNDANRMVLRRRLERRGYSVDDAADGRQAIDKFEASRPDIVLMDLSMPNMSGFEAFERMRALQGDREVPVIAVTAHAMDTIRTRCEESGFAAFVAKPLDFEALVSCIGSLAANDA